MYMGAGGDCPPIWAYPTNARAGDDWTILISGRSRERAVDRAHRIRVPLPGMELGHVNAYLGECGSAGEYYLVDVGLATYEAALGLLNGLRELGVRPSEISFVFITHFHADHITLLQLLSRLTSAKYYIGEADLRIVGSDFDRYARGILDAYGRHGVPGDLLESFRKLVPMVRFRGAFEDVWKLEWHAVRDGEELPCGLRAIWTPGHTPGHTVYAFPGGAYLGDHVLPKITPNISWEGAEGRYYDPLGSYLESLRKVRGLGAGLPAHGDAIPCIDSRVDELLRHHEARLREILKVIDEPMTAYEVARRIRWDMGTGEFDSFDAYNKFFAVGEALSHLRHLEGLALAEELEGPGAVVLWRRIRRWHRPAAGKGLKGERPPLCMGLREVLPALMVLTAAAWALLLIAIFVLAAVVLPIQVPGPRAVYVELQVAKAAAGAVILWAWIYSYLRLRDAVARLLLTPRRSASDRTPP